MAKGTVVIVLGTAARSKLMDLRQIMRPAQAGFGKEHDAAISISTLTRLDLRRVQAVLAFSDHAQLANPMP